MLEIWTSLGVWIRCIEGFAPPNFRNIERHDNLTDDPELFFFALAELSYERINKMADDAEEKVSNTEEKPRIQNLLNMEEKQGIQKLWNILDRIPGVRPLQMALLRGGCSSHGTNGNFESGWDYSTNIDNVNDTIQLKPRAI